MRSWSVSGAAACGGALYFLGFLGFGIWPLLGVFLVPLWYALERSRNVAAPMLAGLVFGMVAYVGGHLWLWRLVDVFLGGNVWVGGALWLLHGLWFSVGFVVYGAVFRWIRARGWSVAMAGIPAFLLVEWLRPLLFPVYAGNALLPLIPIVQIADLGGPLLLTGLVASINVVVFETLRWKRGDRSRPLAVWALGGAAILGTLGYGRLRVEGVERAIAKAPPLRVGLVQANLGLLEKRTQALVTHRRHLEQTRDLLVEGGLDLVVWPETAYLRGIRGPLPVSGQPIRGDLRLPLLFGGTLVRHENGRQIKANSAFLVDADGMIREAYQKNLLIPLAEYVPFATLFPHLRALLPHAQDFAASEETPALRLGEWRISTPICYEAVRPDLVRRMVKEGRPDLLVTLANDAWFGDSQEPWLHLHLARLRAIEHRRYLVRSTNSGVSAIVDPVGRLIAHTGVLTNESLRGVVRPLAIPTLYGRLGDWPGWLSLALVSLALTVRRGAR